MSLADAVTTELAFLRSEAESLMLDAGKALRPTGGHGYNPATKSEGQTFTDLDSGLCKIQTRNLVAREAEVGGRTSATVRTELHRPASSEPLQRGDVWEITAVSSDSLQTVGQRLRVIAPVAGTLKTARRYEVEEAV